MRHDRDKAWVEGARNAGLLLHELLLNDYRHRWLVVSERARSDQVNALAVARVVADHAHRYPSATRGHGTDAYQIKDVIWRAITGRGMSHETLELLIDAFDMSDAHARALWGQWSMADPARVVIGSMAPRDEGPESAPRFLTVQRQELHYLGPDGQPTRHRTVQAIRSLVDGYSTHRYTFDTNEVTVRRVHGGEPGPLHQVSGSIWAVEIALPQPLARGEVASMEFLTEFHNTEPLEPDFRYAAHQRVEDLVIRVEFDPACLPSSVSWCVWEDYREPQPPALSSGTALNAEHAVQRALDVLQGAAVGFTWTFHDS